MYYIRIIDNWNQSQLTKYESITLQASINNIRCITIRSKKRFNISNSFCGGSEITISGSSFGNDGNYTVSVAANMFQIGEYFFQSILVNEATVEEPLFDCTFSLTNGESFYPEIEIKNSLDLENNIFILNNSVERFEAEKFVGDDFFVSEPREATLEFLRTSWLIEKFKNYNKAEELSNILFYNEDELVIGNDGEEHLDWEVGMTVTWEGQEHIIYDKEIIIQQISKYVIEIHSVNEDVREKVFTGFVDKSQTKLSSNKITITINDAMKFIEIYANQLTKDVLDDPDEIDYHVFLSSKDEITKFTDKIKNMTRLNINMANNVIDNYTYTNVSESDVFDIDQAPFSPVNTIQIPSSIVPTVWYVSNPEIHDINIVATNNYGEFLIYRPVSLWGYWQVNVVNGVGDLRARRFLCVQKLSFTEVGVYTTLSLYCSGVGDVFEDNDPEIGEPMPLAIYNDALSSFKAINNISTIATANLNKITGIITVKAILKINERNLVKIYEVECERYGLLIPLYPDTYKYTDIIKMILYVNELRFYCDNNGNLYLNKLYPNENSGDVITLNKRDILLDGYSEVSVQKDYPNLSKALDPIWYDSISEGFFYKKLDIAMRGIYENMLIKRYPSELTCKVLVKSLDTGEERNIQLHSILSCFNKYYIVVERKKNDTGFYYDTKAYELGEYNNQNIMSLFGSVKDNDLEDENANRFSENKIWVDNNLWIDSFGKYNEER